MDKRHHGPHSLRHTLASQMLKNGNELSTISAVLGHSSTQVTTVYLSIDYSNLKACCISMPELHSVHYAMQDWNNDITIKKRIQRFIVGL